MSLSSKKFDCTINFVSKLSCNLPIVGSIYKPTPTGEINGLRIRQITSADTPSTASHRLKVLPPSLYSDETPNPAVHGVPFAHTSSLM